MIKILVAVFICLAFFSNAQILSPTWESIWLGGSSFSSVCAKDLNNDGVQDIVVGAGIEDEESELGIIAINGLNGDTLWTRPSRNQIYSTAIFGNSFSSSETLVYLAGRNAQLLCLNGKDGTLLWEFWPDSLNSAEASGWYNFYTPRIIGDNEEYLLITNGGFASAAPGDPNRPAGKLLILDRFNGAILFDGTFPDSAETYFSPMFWPQSNDIGEDLLVLGSGGETLAGAVWTLTVEEFINSGLMNAKQLLSDTEKGFIQAPAFADLNSDSEYDMIIPRLNNGGLIALDGLTKEKLWTFEIENTESYVSPIVADFSGDGLPDVFNIFARGEFPIYFNYEAHLIDGQSGISLYSEILSLNQFTGGNALDWDKDGTDELLLIQNKNSDLGITHAFRILDFNNDTTYFVTDFKKGSVTFSTPLISDIDGDSLLEIVYVYDPGSFSSIEIAKTGFARFDLDLPSKDVAWAGFLGTYKDGTYRKKEAGNSGIFLNSELRIFPNPASDRLRIITSGNDNIAFEIIDQLGKKCKVNTEIFGRNVFIDTSILSPGLYFLKVTDENFKYLEKVLIQN